MYWSSMWMPTTRPNTTSTVPMGGLPGKRTVLRYSHSNWIGESLTRLGLTIRLSSFSSPARSNSSTPCGSSSALMLTASRRFQVAMFQTNWPICSALRTESLRSPWVVWLALNMTIGGSKVTFWNWL